jgi:hypothetical protein
MCGGKPARRRDRLALGYARPGQGTAGRGLRNTGNRRSAFHLYGRGVACPAEQGYGADCQKRPLRSHFRQRLIPSVRSKVYLIRTFSC